MTLSKEHFDNFIITFLISITAGQTVSKAPQLTAMQNVGSNFKADSENSRT